MKVQLVYFEGCPNADAAREAIQRNLVAASMAVELEEVDTNAADTPAALRTWGSPTVLVDGRDVGGERIPTGTCCRLYDNPANRGVPGDAAIRAALCGEHRGVPMSDHPQLEKNVESPLSRRAKLPLLGAVVAAVAASACCVLPAVLALVGISGVGAAAILEPYRPLLLGVTGLLLATGFYFAYRSPRVVANRTAAETCDCPAPRARRSGKRMLWFATVAVGFLAAYPYLAGATASTHARGDAVQTAASRTVDLRVDGMTCAGCASQIVGALSAVPGVVTADISFDDETARVVYDPARATPQALADAVTALDGYSAKVMTP